MNHCHKKVKGNQKANDKKAKEKMKYIDKILTKTERNRLHMEIYHQESCSEKQKQKIRECDRKRAAVTRLKKKMKQESNREKSRKRSKKYRNSKEIPTSPEKFEKLSTRFITLQKILPGKQRLLQIQWLHITLV